MTKRAPASRSMGADTSPVCAPFAAGVAVLRAHRHGAALQRRRDLPEQGEGRADQQLGAPAPRGALGHRARQRQAVGAQPVHLPIAGDQRAHSGGHGGRPSASGGDAARPPIVAARRFGNRCPLPLGTAPKPPARPDTMLTALRRLASTWVAKALFVLLVLSFAIWGIGDTVRNPSAATPRSPASTASRSRWRKRRPALRREMQRLSRPLGSRFENDPRVRRALAEQAVDQLVLDRVLRAETARLGSRCRTAVVREFVLLLSPASAARPAAASPAPCSSPSCASTA